MLNRKVPLRALRDLVAKAMLACDGVADARRSGVARPFASRSASEPRAEPRGRDALRRSTTSGSGALASTGSHCSVRRSPSDAGCRSTRRAPLVAEPSSRPAESFTRSVPRSSPRNARDSMRARARSVSAISPAAYVCPPVIGSPSNTVQRSSLVVGAWRERYRANCGRTTARSGPELRGPASTTRCGGTGGLRPGSRRSGRVTLAGARASPDALRRCSVCALFLRQAGSSTETTKVR
jgi:hypothetical protein